MPTDRTWWARMALLLAVACLILWALLLGFGCTIPEGAVQLIVQEGAIQANTQVEAPMLPERLVQVDAPTFSPGCFAGLVSPGAVDLDVKGKTEAPDMTGAWPWLAGGVAVSVIGAVLAHNLVVRPLRNAVSRRLGRKGPD